MNQTHWTLRKEVPAFYSMMFYSWCLSMIFLDKNSTHPIMRYRYLMYSKKSCEKSSFLIQCPQSFALLHFRETRGTTGFQSSSSSTCWAVFKWWMNGSKPPRDWYHTNCCTSSPHTIQVWHIYLDLVQVCINHIQAKEAMKVISRSPWMQLWHGGLLLSCFTNQYGMPCLTNNIIKGYLLVQLIFEGPTPKKKVTFDKPSGHRIVHLNKFECI